MNTVCENVGSFAISAKLILQLNVRSFSYRQKVNAQNPLGSGSEKIMFGRKMSVLVTCARANPLEIRANTSIAALFPIIVISVALSERNRRSGVRSECVSLVWLYYSGWGLSPRLSNSLL